MPRSYQTAQKLLPLLLDNLEDYTLFMMDTEGVILTWTPGVKRLLGYEETEFLGQNTALIFTPQDCEAGIHQMELTRAEQDGRSEDVRWHQRKDGTQFWANGQMIALRDDEGQLRGFAKILRDDTRRKQIEDTLTQTREKLQTALDVGRIGTWVWDIPNDRVDADANLSRFFGVSPADAAGGPVARYLEVIHPDDIERVSATITSAIESGNTFISDYRIVQKGGDVLWVEARGQVERDDRGNPLHLNGVILDISERKRAEAAFRRSEERYRTLFEAINNGFCVLKMLFDENGKPVDYRFLEINPTFERQTGLRDAIGKTALELVPDLDDFWFQTYGKVALTGESIHFENSADAMGRWFDVHAFRVGVPEDHNVALLFTDITARKQGEDALRQAHAQAEETNRMKDEFLATLSHELRTPLNAILGWANILRLNELDLKTQEQALETIERNARTQAQLINDLLDVSRILTGKLRLELRPVVLAEVIDNAINTVKPAADAKQISIATTLDRGVDSISGDADRLNQIFWNLLSNSIKFTPSGGHIAVAMSRVEKGLQVRISDSGQGIPPDFLPFVFERFRQADASSTRSYGGLGIGLALVRHLMEAHGGTVTADSKGQGQGATFTVTFPLSLSHQTPEETIILPRDSKNDMTLPLLSGLRILLVDDEADARTLIKLAMTHQGASVEVADSAATATMMIGQSRASGHPFDVLVSDIGMPEEDGHSLIRRIRASEKQDGDFLPAIALTAYATHKDRMNALLAGFQVHIAKPVEPSELLATVAALIGRTGHTS
ncbi:sensory/regulatory protein RpfC [Abditibacteriota bacterium]|nr:sensory/regulatory protein RpfC [Abditibacteriota bacterium]